MNQVKINALCFGKEASLCIEIQGVKLSGNGEVVVTGCLGTSAYEAMLVARTRLCLIASQFTNHDYHLHFAYPSTKKDGPSWGVACYLALSFLSMHLPYLELIAATGEIDLFGNVNPVLYMDKKLVAWGKSRCNTLLVPGVQLAECSKNVSSGIYGINTLDELDELIKRIR